MRPVFLGLLAAMPCLSTAQTPDVLIKIDLRLATISQPGRDTEYRTYDLYGRHSTVALEMLLEPGFQAVFRQRFQLIRNDPDDDHVDEAYVEDPGYWKVGKQVMPFGQGELLRESVYGLRVDTEVGGDALPARLFVCDGGSGMPKGLVARFGKRFGLSVVVGEHFGVSGTAFTSVRQPEDSPGEGAGFRQGIGLDFASRSKRWGGRAEFAAFLRGQGGEPSIFRVSDVEVFVEPSAFHRISARWSRNWGQKNDVVALEARIFALEGVWFEPFAQLRGGSIQQFGFVIHVAR